MDLEEIGKAVVEQGQQLAVLVAVSTRVEKKVDDIGTHNGLQDKAIATLSANQLSTQRELTEHKKPVNHPNGSLSGQVKAQWAILIVVMTALITAAVAILQKGAGA